MRIACDHLKLNYIHNENDSFPTREHSLNGKKV